MKIKRMKDGKVYQVIASANAIIMGVEIPSCLDYLVHGTDNADDVLEWRPTPEPGQIWLDGYQCYRAADDAPVDVP
jgi:hypothetical protein